eukprot:m.102000 g.102000  ORF g.102000 m.102000 type:complete len:120 (+) comp12524_c0_seq3:1338-1697(+)
MPLEPRSSFEPKDFPNVGICQVLRPLGGPLALFDEGASVPPQALEAQSFRSQSETFFGEGQAIKSTICEAHLLIQIDKFSDREFEGCNHLQHGVPMTVCDIAHKALDAVNCIEHNSSLL